MRFGTAIAVTGLLFATAYTKHEAAQRDGSYHKYGRTEMGGGRGGREGRESSLHKMGIK